MNWIKQANKIGKYETTRNGFRIYWKIQPQMHSYITANDRGEKIRRTEFLPGVLVAVDKTGCILKTQGGLDKIGYLIDIEIITREFAKQQ